MTEEYYGRGYYIDKKGLLNIIEEITEDIEKSTGKTPSYITLVFPYEEKEELKNRKPYGTNGTIRIWYEYDLPLIKEIIVDWKKELNEKEIDNIFEYYKKYTKHPKAHYTKDVLSCIPLKEWIDHMKPTDEIYELKEFEIRREGPFFDEIEKYEYDSLKVRCDESYRYPELRKYFNDTLEILEIEIPEYIKPTISSLQEFIILMSGGTCVKTPYKPLNRENFPEAFVHIIEDGKGSFMPTLSSEYEISKIVLGYLMPEICEWEISLKEGGGISFDYLPKDYVKEDPKLREIYKVPKDLINYTILTSPLEEKVKQIVKDLGIEYIEIIDYGLNEKSKSNQETPYV